MRRGLDDGAGALFGFDRIGERGGIFHEDAAAYKDSFSSKLHDERSVGRRGNSPRGEIRHGELTCFRNHPDEFVRRAVLFGLGVEFFFAEDGENFHLLHDLADVLDRVYNVAGARFPFGADHGCAFGDAAQRFAKIARPAHEWNIERMLVDMMSLVGRRQHFGLVDVVDAEFLQDLRFRKMSNAALRHHRNRNSGHDLANLFRRSHARNPALRADLLRHPLEGHDGDGSRLFRNRSLLSIGHIHYDTAFEHLGEAGFEAETGGATIVIRHGGDSFLENAFSFQLPAKLSLFYSAIAIRGTPQQNL